jgi:hypothetical protein
MADEIEKLLGSFRVAGAPERLRAKIVGDVLGIHAAARSHRAWPWHAFRGAIAAVLLVSLGLIHSANKLYQESARQVGVGPPHWTPEAEQAADLLDPRGNSGRRYIALCLVAGGSAAPRTANPQGESQ